MSQDERDHYEILEVPPTASAAEIKAAWRRLVQQTHPDAGGSAALFRMVNEAYRVLSSPTERAAHDRRRPTTTGPASSGTGPAREPHRARAPDPEPEREPTRASDPQPQHHAAPGPAHTLGNSRQLGPAAAWAAPATVAVYVVAFHAMRAASEAGTGTGIVSTLWWSLVALALALFGLTVWIALPVSIGISLNGVWGIVTRRRGRSRTTHPEPR